MIQGYVGTRYDVRVVNALVEACKKGEVANGVVRQRIQTGKAPGQADEDDPYSDVLEMRGTAPPNQTPVAESPMVLTH